MKPWTTLIICMAALAILAVLATLCAYWLRLIVRRPAQWLSLSDRMDDFVVRIGVMPRSLAEKSKRFNRGWGRKLMIGLVTFALVESVAGFLFLAFCLIRLEILLHR